MAAPARTVRSSRGAFALALLACALLMRLLVPQGWMPSQAGHGWTLTICTGNGPLQVEMPADHAGMAMAGQGSDKQHHSGPDHPCAFSAASQALDGPALAPLAMPPLAMLSALPPLALIATVGRGLAAPPPPPTGPPATL